MKSDIELLELAAKAAGYDIRPHPDGTNRFERQVLSGCKGYYNNWDPLKSDSAAFQLIVDLDLIVESLSGADTYRAMPPTGEKQWFSESGKDGATFPGRAGLRRAIVRAAAAMGEAL